MDQIYPRKIKVINNEKKLSLECWVIWLSKESNKSKPTRAGDGANLGKNAYLASLEEVDIWPSCVVGGMVGESGNKANSAQLDWSLAELGNIRSQNKSK